METKKSCSDCAYWLKDNEDAARGSCHRYPPQGVAVLESNAIGLVVGQLCRWLFPVTYSEDWCGEFSEWIDEDGHDELGRLGTISGEL